MNKNLKEALDRIQKIYPGRVLFLGGFLLIIGAGASIFVESTSAFAACLVVTAFGGILLLKGADGLLGITSAKHSLGFPQGSVRALMALLIIGIVVIFTLRFNDAFRTLAYIEYNVDSEDRAKALEHSSEAIYIGLIPDEEANSGQAKARHVVLLPNTQAEAHSDFITQVTTVLLTVFATLGAFYFGTKASGRASTVDEKKIREDLLSAGQDVDRLEVEIGGLEDDISKLKGQIGKLDDKLKTMENNSPEKTQTEENLNSRRSEVKAKEIELREKRSALEKAMQNYDLQIALVKLV